MLLYMCVMARSTEYSFSLLIHTHIHSWLTEYDQLEPWTFQALLILFFVAQDIPMDIFRMLVDNFSNFCLIPKIRCVKSGCNNLFLKLRFTIAKNPLVKLSYFYSLWRSHCHNLLLHILPLNCNYFFPVRSSFLTMKIIIFKRFYQ